MVAVEYTKGQFKINGTGHAEREAANELACMLTDADIVAEVEYSWTEDTITIVQVGVWENGEIVYI
jgi:hypothetical protein